MMTTDPDPSDLTFTPAAPGRPWFYGPILVHEIVHAPLDNLPFNTDVRDWIEDRRLSGS